MTEVMATKVAPESIPQEVEQAAVSRLDHLSAHLETVLALSFAGVLVVITLVVIGGWVLSELSGHGSGPLGNMAQVLGGAVAGTATNKVTPKPPTS